MPPVAKPPKVQISRDGLEATITFPIPEGGTAQSKYSVSQLVGYLHDKGVTYGIDQEMLSVLSDEPIYSKPMLVAKGYPPEEGQPGFYDFKFERVLDKKPIVRPDGTTDYMNIKTMEIVHKDDIIAVYHPAKQGTSGMSVKGAPVPGKPCRDLPPLVGRGFTRDDANIVYTSALDGKIELNNNNRVIISPIHEVKGDADITTGNIDFNGDVIIHGAVRDGVVIKAAGTITIKGLVESCEINAGKDLFLLSGIKGGEKTVIEVGGSMTAQFMEFVRVKCNGNITADYMFNCHVVCDGRVELSGKKASIIGGYVSAVQGMDVNEIGNSFGTETTVAVGVDREHSREIARLRDKIAALSENVNKIKNGLDIFAKASIEKGIDYTNDPRRIQLLRVKIRDESILNKDKEDLVRILEVAKKGDKAYIKVFKRVFYGTNVCMDDNRVSLKEDFGAVEFVKTEEGIRMEGIF